MKACEVKNKINPLIGCNPSTPCMSGCLDAIAMTPGCLTEFDAMTACAAKEPPSSFKCSSKYGAQLQDTACKAASDKFFACAFGG